MTGRWKIVKMEQWDQKYIDLIESSYIAFEIQKSGLFRFGCKDLCGNTFVHHGDSSKFNAKLAGVQYDFPIFF